MTGSRTPDPDLQDPARGGDDGRSSGRFSGALPQGFDRLIRTALVIIPIGVIGNIAFSLAVTDREILRSVAGFPRDHLVFALLLTLFPWLTNTLRLLIWTDFLGHRLTFREGFRITLATDMGAAVSPTAVGGGLFKWALLMRKGVSPGAAASLATLSPFEDGVFFLLAIPTALFISASWDNPALDAAAEAFRRNAVPALLITAGIAVLTWLTVRWALKGGLGERTQRQGRRLVQRVRRTLHGIWMDAREVYRLIRVNGKLRFALSLSLTGLQWTARYSVVSLLIAFLGAPVQPVLFWLLQWVVFTVASFIPTPGAAGGAEAAFFLVYSPFVPSEVLGLATAGWRFLTFYLLLGLASILYLLIGERRR